MNPVKLVKALAQGLVAVFVPPPYAAPIQALVSALDAGNEAEAKRNFLILKVEAERAALKRVRGG